MLGRKYEVWTPNLRDVPQGTIGTCIQTFRPCYIDGESCPPTQIIIQDDKGKVYHIPSLDLLRRIIEV